MKKLILPIILCPLLCLAACSKGMSFEDAIKFINENYTSTDTISVTVTSVRKVTKSEGIFATFLPVGETTTTLLKELSPITEEEATRRWSKSSFSLDGKKLIINSSGNIKDFIESLNSVYQTLGNNLDGTYRVTTTINEQGYIIEEKTILDSTFTTSGSNTFLNGSFSIEQTATVTIE